MAGNITYLGDGRYRLRTSKGTGTNRKPYSKNVECKNQNVGPDGKLESGKYPRAIEKALADFVSDIEKGEYVEPSRMSLKEYIDKWFTEYDGKDIQETTAVCYKGMIKKRIIPAMGHLKIEDIKPVHIKSFLSNLSEDGIREDGQSGGLSGNTIKKYHRILGSMFQDALYLGLLKTNPVRSVKSPVVKKKEARHFELEDICEVLKALTEEPFKYQVMVVLDMLTGARRGEVIALTWNKIDFTNKTIRINSSVKYVAKKGLEDGEPKNEMSKRTISIPDFIVDVLKRYKSWQSEKFLVLGLKLEESDYLFHQESNIKKPMHPDTASSWFPEFLERHNLPKINFHAIRHTHASILMALDMDVVSAASRIGHSQKSTFLDIYSHMLKRRDKETADRLNSLFMGNETGHILDTYVTQNSTTETKDTKSQKRTKPGEPNKIKQKPVQAKNNQRAL